MSENFFENNKGEIVRIINVSMVLFALLVGFNIGSNSLTNEIKIKNERIAELNSYIEIDEKEHQAEILKVTASCDQKINEAKLQEKQQKEQAFEDYKLICQQMKCK